MEAFTMDMNYKKILVAVDGSFQSKKAVVEAVKVAERNKALLHVLHVKNKERPYENRNLEEQALVIVKEVSDIIDHKVSFEVYQVMGSPKREIVSFANIENCDLVVIGVSGKEIIKRALVGSTTLHVLVHAQCDVLVIK